MQPCFHRSGFAARLLERQGNPCNEVIAKPDVEAGTGVKCMDRDIVLAASTVPELFRKAVEAYGTIHAAAAGLGVPYATLRRWLRDE